MPCQTKSVCCMTNLASGLGRWGAYFGTWWSTQRPQEPPRCFSYTFVHNLLNVLKSAKSFPTLTFMGFSEQFLGPRGPLIEPSIPVRPPVRANFSWVHRWAETLPSGLRDPSNRIFSESPWCQLSKFRQKYKYRDKDKDKDKDKDNDKDKDKDKDILRTPPKSNPRDLWPLRHFIRVMRRLDLTKKTQWQRQIQRQRQWQWQRKTRRHFENTS